jgi:selenide,water dikinase
LRNVVTASKVGARVFLDQVPVLSAAREYVQAGIAPGGTHANHRFLKDWVSYADDITKEEQLLLCDAQTSGGLLAAVAPQRLPTLLSDLHSRGVSDAVAIGMIESSNPGRISVIRSGSSQPVQKR